MPNEYILSGWNLLLFSRKARMHLFSISITFYCFNTLWKGDESEKNMGITIKDRTFDVRCSLRQSIKVAGILYYHPRSRLTKELNLFLTPLWRSSYSPMAWLWEKFLERRIQLVCIIPFKFSKSIKNSSREHEITKLEHTLIIYIARPSFICISRGTNDNLSRKQTGWEFSVAFRMSSIAEILIISCTLVWWVISSMNLFKYMKKTDKKKQ